MTRIGEGRDLGRLEGCRLLGLALRNSERTVELRVVLSGDGPAAHMSGREPAIGALAFALDTKQDSSRRIGGDD
jgi:hypothetical protein